LGSVHDDPCAGWVWGHAPFDPSAPIPLLLPDPEPPEEDEEPSTAEAPSAALASDPFPSLDASGAGADPPVPHATNGSARIHPRTHPPGARDSIGIIGPGRQSSCVPNAPLAEEHLDFGEHGCSPDFLESNALR
jgi:hypothetical protein